MTLVSPIARPHRSLADGASAIVAGLTCDAGRFVASGCGHEVWTCTTRTNSSGGRKAVLSSCVESFTQSRGGLRGRLSSCNVGNFGLRPTRKVRSLREYSQTVFHPYILGPECDAQSRQGASGNSLTVFFYITLLISLSWSAQVAPARLQSGANVVVSNAAV